MLICSLLSVPQIVSALILFLNGFLKILNADPFRGTECLNFFCVLGTIATIISEGAVVLVYLHGEPPAFIARRKD